MEMSERIWEYEGKIGVTFRCYTYGSGMRKIDFYLSHLGGFSKYQDISVIDTYGKLWLERIYTYKGKREINSFLTWVNKKRDEFKKMFEEIDKVASKLPYQTYRE